MLETCCDILVDAYKHNWITSRDDIDVTPWRAYEHIERLEHICKIVLASGKYK